MLGAGPDGRVGAPPGRLRPQGLAQRLRDRSRARRSSTSGLVNRADDADDRVTVRVESRQRDIVHRPRTATRSRAPASREIATARRVLDARQARRPLDPALDRAGRGGRAPPRRRDRRLAVGRRRAPARRGGHRARDRRRRARRRRSPRSPTSTSTAPRAPPRSTSRWSTAASRPTCSRPPRAGRSPPGPRPSTATTPRSSAPPRPRPCASCSTPATPASAPGSSSAARACARCASPRCTPTRRRPR